MSDQCCGGGCGSSGERPKDVSQQEIFFGIARDCSSRSTCVKTKTGAVIVKDGEVLSTSQNLCAPDGCEYGDKVERCPREGMKTGTGYELCQPMHAEVMACLNAKAEKLSPQQMAQFAGHLVPSAEAILAAFAPDDLVRLNGATLYLVGHYWACENCKRFCRIVGVQEILFDPVTGKATEEKYKVQGLTNESPPAVQ